jgi:hypothetical protein
MIFQNSIIFREFLRHRLTLINTDLTYRGTERIDSCFVLYILSFFDDLRGLICAILDGKVNLSHFAHSLTLNAMYWAERVM